MSTGSQMREVDVELASRQDHVLRDAVVIGVLLAVGVVLGIASLREGLGTLGETGSGFFPFVAALALIGSGVVALLEVLRDGATPGSAPAVAGSETPDRPGRPRVSPEFLRLVGVLGCAALVPLLAETVGFVTTLTVSVVGMAKIAGLRGWFRPVATGLVFGGVVWGVFVIWLNVPLPIGQFGLG